MCTRTLALCILERPGIAYTYNMLCPPFPRLETIDLKTKKEGKLGMSGGGGERGEGAYVCECMCTQVASRVLTHINFVSIFVLPVVK